MSNLGIQSLYGTLWFGDEFGSFLLHTNAEGRVLEAPIPLPDFDNHGREIRSPQNPYNEESSVVRIMNAVRMHAQINGNRQAPVFSPRHVMLDDENPETFVSSRQNPPQDSGLAKASSELFNLNSIHRAGYPVVVWTVNDIRRMEELIDLDVDGIISDRPDLLLQAVKNYDAAEDGKPDLLDKDGLIDISRFDAQGHRGARNMRPENTLPAMEAALDSLMTTLETDTGITLDGIPVLSHDPYIKASKCHKADGSSYEYEDEVLIRGLTADKIQSLFISDKLLPGRPDQTNDPALSPVAVIFAKSRDLTNPYVMPTLQQLFNFVVFYTDYYHSGVGSNHPESAKRWKNAQRIRFNIETKINPRSDKDSKGRVFSERTIGPELFAMAVANLVKTNGLENRADIQSFDFRTLLTVQEQFPNIRTVYLFSDFPKVGDSGDGTNLQDENGYNTPWMAGLLWPYRITLFGYPFRAQRSGGFEGMALTSDGKNLLPLLEKPLTGG